MRSEYFSDQVVSIIIKRDRPAGRRLLGPGEIGSELLRMFKRNMRSPMRTSGASSLVAVFLMRPEPVDCNALA